MKKFIFSAAIILSSATSFLYAQCNNGAQVPGNLTPNAVGQSVDLTYAGGRYVLAYVEKGANYTISTAHNGYWQYDPFFDEEDWINTAYDTQLSAYYDETGEFIAFNDDYFGILAEISFTASKCGWIRIFLHRYLCAATSLTASVRMTQNTAGTSNIALSITQPNVITCPMVPLAVTSEATGGTLPYAYSWDVPSLMQNATPSPENIIANSDSTWVLTVIDADYCRASANVNVVTLSAAHLDLGADVTACTQAVLSATQSDVTYLWNDNSTSATLDVTNSGNYILEVTNTDGCKDKDTIHVTINPLPVVDLGADQSFCNTSYNFDLTNADHSFIWNNGSPSASYNANTTGNVWVEVTDINTGCVNSDTVHLTFNPLPILDLGGDLAFCDPSYTIDVTQPNGEYLWNDNSTAATYIVTSTGNVWVRLTDALTGCVNSDTAHFTFNPLPEVDLGADQSFCNASYTFDLTSPNYSFIWNNGSPSASYNANTTGNVWVEVTDMNTGCMSSDTVHLTFNPLPILDLGTDQTQCGGTFTIDVTQPNAEYLWSDNSTAGSFSSLNSAQVWVQLTDTLTGCVNSDTMQVTIHVLPAVSIVQTVSTLCLQGGTATLEGSPANGEFSGTGITGNVFDANTAGIGVHEVTYTYSDENDCEVAVSVNITVVSCLSVNESELFDMTVFPNPSEGLVNVKLSNATPDWRVVVTDLQGKVWKDVNSKTISGTTLQLDFTGYSSGMYFISLQSVQGRVTRSVIIR